VHAEVDGELLKTRKEKSVQQRLAYRVNEVMSLTGLGRTTIYKLIGNGELGRIKVGSSTLIPAEDIKALLQRDAA
jgi:excisionase family DNA binding protein